MKIIKTSSEVIDALGGTTAVAKMTNNTLPVVSNWRRTSGLPTNTYILVTHRLKKLKCKATLDCWPHMMRP